jgi:hypothetical protein
VTPSRITPEKMLDLILAEDVYNRQIASLRERYLGRVDRLEDPFAGRRPERDRLPCYGSYVYDSSSDDYSDWQDASAGEHLVQEEREESQPNNGQGNLESGDVDLQEATIIQELQQPGELYNAEVIAGANAEASNEESDEPLGENFGQDTQQGDVDLEVVRDGADEVTPNPTEKSSESVVKEQNVGIASQHSFSRLIFFQQPTRYARLYPAQSLQEPQPFQGVAQNAVGALVVGPPASQAQPPLNTAQSTGPPATQRPTPPAEASHDEAITTPAQPANTRYRRPPHRARAQKLTNRDFYNTAEYDRNPTGFDAAHQELGTASMAGIDGYKSGKRRERSPNMAH